MTRTLRTAVVTGRHPYDVPAFQRLFRDLPGIDAYPQSLEDFALSRPAIRDAYDVLVFFNFHLRTPTGDEAPDNGESTKASRQAMRTDQAVTNALESLGEDGRGLMIWHHALLAFPSWDHWSALCGMADRSFTDVTVDQVWTGAADADHPITADVEPWEMRDEVYLMGPPDPGCEILLTTDHPKSMRALAWTHTVRRSRVLVYQSGHDAHAYAHPTFRRVMAQGIRWLGGPA